jgi:hypothetical protein
MIKVQYSTATWCHLEVVGSASNKGDQNVEIRDEKGIWKEAVKGIEVRKITKERRTEVRYENTKEIFPRIISTGFCF